MYLAAHFARREKWSDVWLRTYLQAAANDFAGWSGTEKEHD